MVECGICGAQTHDLADGCPECGAKLRREYRGLISAPFFFLVGGNVFQESVFWGAMICLAGLYAMSTVRHLWWVPANNPPGGSASPDG